MSENITDLDQSNFEAFIASSNATVLVDFWAPWCGPQSNCSYLRRTRSEKPDTVKIGKVNVDNNSELASQYEVGLYQQLKSSKMEK